VYREGRRRSEREAVERYCDEKEWRKAAPHPSLASTTEEEIAKIRKHERTGRPLGSEGFVDGLE